jgi:hypothetical protein
VEVPAEGTHKVRELNKLYLGFSRSKSYSVCKAIAPARNQDGLLLDLSRCRRRSHELPMRYQSCCNHRTGYQQCSDYHIELDLHFVMASMMHKQNRAGFHGFTFHSPALNP